MITIIEYFKYIIELYSYLFFMINILDYKIINHMLKKIFIVLLFGLLNLYFSKYIYTTFIISLILICLLIDGHVFKRICGTLVSIIIISLFFFAPYYLIENEQLLIKTFGEIGIYAGIIGLTFFLNEIGVREIFTTKPDVGFLNIIALLFLGFSVYIFLNKDHVYVEKVILFYLILSLIILIASLIYSFIFLHNKKLMVKYENENIQKEIIIKTQEKYYMSILNNYEKLRQFKHDINAHLSAMQYLINMQKYEELENYIYAFDVEIKEIQNCNLTNHDIINAVISQLHNNIKENDIKFEINDFTKREFKIQSIEIVSLFYNLINNAIEAAMQSEEKSIIIAIKSNKNSFVIKVENSISTHFNINNIYTGKTTKMNKDNHGIGLSNIKMIVEKHNGYIDYQVDNIKLITHIILFD